MFLARPAGAATVHISIKDFFFSPKVDTVLVQDSVVWTNDGGATHTATSDSIPASATGWSTGFLGPGSSGGTRFTQLGMYRYRCEVHASMVGRIVVISSLPVQNVSWGK